MKCTGLNFFQVLFSTTRFSSVLSCEDLLISQFLQSCHDVLIVSIRFSCKVKFCFHCEMTVRCLFVSQGPNSLIKTVKCSTIAFYVPKCSTSPRPRNAWELEPTSLRVIWPDPGRLIFKLPATSEYLNPSGNFVTAS